MAKHQTDGDHIVIIGGVRYRREAAAARGLIAGPVTESDTAAKDARIAELEARIAELEADKSPSDDDKASNDEDEPKEGEQAADAKTRPAPPNKARSAAAK